MKMDVDVAVWVTKAAFEKKSGVFFWGQGEGWFIWGSWMGGEKVSSDEGHVGARGKEGVVRWWDEYKAVKSIKKGWGGRLCMEAHCK
jgi:hypothetical protein